MISKKNPGPSQKNTSLNICHWNLNGITAHNYVKLSLLQAYNAIENYDVICLSETFLDSSNENDENLSINGYDMFRCNSPNNSKRGGVCIYFKESLPFIKRDDLSSLNECLVCELKFGKAKCFVTTLYRSPSQSKEEFRKFEISLEV